MRTATVGKDTHIIIDLYRRGTNRKLIAQALGWKKSQIDYIIGKERRREKRQAMFDHQMAETAAIEIKEAIDNVAAETLNDAPDNGAIEFSVPVSVASGLKSSFEPPVRLRFSVSVV